MTTATKPTCELCGEPLPEGEEMFKFHGYSSGCPKPSLTKSVPIMNDRHPSHVTRISDASSFDEVCINCGATDITGGGWGALANPCPKASITQQTMTDAEKLRDAIIGIANEHLPLGHAQTIADKIIALLPPLEILTGIKDKTWKAVPVEPTEAMFEAAEEGYVRSYTGTATISSGCCYRSMLAAAPEKPE